MARSVASALSDDDDVDSSGFKTKRIVREKPKSKRVITSPNRYANEEKVWIILEDNEKIPPTGQFFQLIAEGATRSWVLRPGVAAEVPKALLNIINDAIEAVPEKDPDTMRIVRYRDRLRFPYRLVEPPREAEAA